MSFLDHIAACNNHDPTNFNPFRVEGAEVGAIRPAVANRLRDFPDVFTVGDDRVDLAAGLSDYQSRTHAVDRVLRQMTADDLMPPWRDENYPVVEGYGKDAWFEMERAAVPLFGVRAFGVHINGYVRRADGGIDMWIGRRGADRTVCPNMLDNMVAGGQPVGLSLMENVVKECGEEASIPPEIARTAVSTGAISYAMETKGGLKPDTMFCYDMELPADFTPVNADGEIAEFYRWPVEEIARIVDETFDFKFNCNLVIVDFLIRHGIIPPEHPDYIALLKGLHR